MNAYLTLRRQAQTEYVVQKSRFIASAAPAGSTDEALSYLAAIRQEHRGASHNCFAYIIGQNKGIIRYSDDGEPSGTAGKPIVDVMLARDVVDCAVVIIRYFGGILLGAGGLVRAYAHAASLALDAAGACAMHETARVRIKVAYPFWDKVQHTLQSLPVIVEDTAYTQDVALTLLVKTADAESMLRTLQQATDGKLQAIEDEVLFFHPWDV